MNNDNRYFYDFVVADLFGSMKLLADWCEKQVGTVKERKKKNTIMWRKNKCCRLLSHWRFILHW